ncbi:MAG: NAD(P)/FAD-dependent oxidoreductase [bacterium]|nr:NAD(P)/FAD-dependent oxidoreductase [bacterium]
MHRTRIAIIGGGAAGFFAAITCAESAPDCEVVILEAGEKPLAKVLVSGGGRCNLTNNCPDTSELVRNYPRGAKELRGAFSRFNVQDTIEWFEERGVKLKTEADGRMFPTTDDSATIAGCLTREAERAGVRLWTAARVRSIKHETVPEPEFILKLGNGQEERFSRVVVASGGGKTGFELAQMLGHTIIAPVPSLFTFAIVNKRLDGLSGLSFPKVDLQLGTLSGRKFSQTGPLLITHWGLSGPAVIKLSAWAARGLHVEGYQSKLRINFISGCRSDEVVDLLKKQKLSSPRKELRTVLPLGLPFELPRRYWLRLLDVLELPDRLVWAEVPDKQLKKLAQEMTEAEFQLQGKGVFKEEFVTCGGVMLKEVDFRKMESKLCPGLYFAGEVLDIDGVTGGFNFQAAWTTGYIVGTSAANGK